MTVQAVAVRNGSVSGDDGVGGGKSSGRVPTAFKSMHAAETCTSGGKRCHRRTTGDNSSGGGGDSERLEMVRKSDGDRNGLYMHRLGERRNDRGEWLHGYDRTDTTSTRRTTIIAY